MSYEDKILRRIKDQFKLTENEALKEAIRQASEAKVSLGQMRSELDEAKDTIRKLRNIVTSERSQNRDLRERNKGLITSINKHKECQKPSTKD